MILTPAVRPFVKRFFVPPPGYGCLESWVLGSHFRVGAGPSAETFYLRPPFISYTFKWLGAFLTYACYLYCIIRFYFSLNCSDFQALLLIVLSAVYVDIPTSEWTEFIFWLLSMITNGASGGIHIKTQNPQTHLSGGRIIESKCLSLCPGQYGILAAISREEYHCNIYCPGFHCFVIVPRAGYDPASPMWKIDDLASCPTRLFASSDSALFPVSMSFMAAKIVKVRNLSNHTRMW